MGAAEGCVWTSPVESYAVFLGMQGGVVSYPQSYPQELLAGQTSHVARCARAVLVLLTQREGGKNLQCHIGL